MVTARANLSDQKVRHSARYPCPICGGWDAMPHGQGIRCGGWTVGEWVYCQRPQFGGRAPYSPAGDVYRHRMAGNCLCGVMHGATPTQGYGAPEYVRRQPTPIRPKALTERRTVVQRYDYHDAAGRTVFQVERLTPKGFRQRRPDGIGGWVWNLDGVQPMLYRLPELLAAPADQPVFIVEGEKDVERLRMVGIVATCNPMGAGKWRREYNDALSGRGCVVLADNDAAGARHAEDVARSLTGIAASVRVMTLPGLPDKGDVCDWLDAGGSADQLLAWAAVWPLWQSPSAFSTSNEGPKQEVAEPEGKCRRACSCCGWRRTVLRAAANPGSRTLLPVALAMDDHFRRREARGLSVTEGFRISTAFKAREAGCSPGTYLSAAKELSEKGALMYQQRHVRAGDKRPGGGSYVRPETHSYLTVPGGPDAFLARVASLAAEPERRGGRRTPQPLPACDSCGSRHIALYCPDCGEFQADEPATKGDASTEGSLILEVPGDESPPVSENQTLLPIYGGGGVNNPTTNATPERICTGEGIAGGCSPGHEAPDQCWCLDFDADEPDGSWEP